jgi:hypothetical protein
MMQSKGISMSANYTKANGMTAQEMDGVLAKHFSKIQTNVTTFDQNGIRSWSESNGIKQLEITTVFKNGFFSITYEILFKF